MIADTVEAKDVTREQAQPVLDAINAFVERTQCSRGYIARAIGSSPPVISQVLNSRYLGDWQKIVIKLDRFLEEEAKRETAPRSTTFVWTRVAQEIKTVADSASTMKRIMLVYGPDTSGIGKTMALQAIHAEKPGAVLVTIEKAHANPFSMLQTIARGLREDPAGNSAQIYYRIKSKLLGSPRLLMIDQIHNLCGCKDDKPFFMLCDLWDATRSPQLWCGTTDIVEYLHRGQAKGKETLAQVRRRIALWRDLLARTRDGGGDSGDGEPLYTVDEIKKIFARNKMRLAPDAAQYLCALACLPDAGALGTCQNIVDLATLVHGGPAGAGQTVLTLAMIRAAHKSLLDAPAFRLVERKMDEASAVGNPVRMVRAG